MERERLMGPGGSGSGEFGSVGDEIAVVMFLDLVSVGEGAKLVRFLRAGVRFLTVVMAKGDKSSIMACVLNGSSAAMTSAFIG